MILLGQLSDPAELPDESVISAITLAELSVGPHVANDNAERGARQQHLQQKSVEKQHVMKKLTGNPAYSVTAYSWQFDKRLHLRTRRPAMNLCFAHSGDYRGQQIFLDRATASECAAPVLGRWPLPGESSRYLEDGLQMERAVGRARGGAVRYQFCCHPPTAEMRRSSRRSRSGSSLWAVISQRRASDRVSQGPARSAAERDCAAVYLRAVRREERRRQDMRIIDLGFAVGSGMLTSFISLVRAMDQAPA